MRKKIELNETFGGILDQNTKEKNFPNPINLGTYGGR